MPYSRMFCITLFVVLYGHVVLAINGGIPVPTYTDHIDTLELYQTINKADLIVKLYPDSLLYLMDIVEEQNRLLMQKSIASGSQTIIAECEYLRGRAYRYKGEYSLAGKYYYKAFDLFSLLNNAEGLAKCYHGLGNLNLVSGTEKLNPSFYRKAVALRDSLQLVSDLSTSLTNLGIVYYRLGIYDSSEVVQLQSLAIRTKLQDTSKIAATLNNLGNLYTIMAQYNKALNIYEHGLAYVDTNLNIRRVASLYNNIGNVKMHMANYNEALYFFQKAYIIYQEVEDIYHSGQVLLNLGSLNHKMHRLTIASGYLNQALTSFMMVENQWGIAESYFELGRIYKEDEKYDRAMRYFLLALRIKEELNDPRGIGESYENIGSVFFELKEPDSARINFIIALDYYQSLDYSYGIASVNNSLSVLSIQEGAMLKAISYAKKSLSYSVDYHGFYEQMLSHDNMALAYEKIGYYKSSLFHFKQSKQIADSLFDEKTAESIFELELKYQSESMKQTMERQQLLLDKRKAEILSTQREYDLQQRIRNLLVIAAIVLIILILWILRDWLAKRKVNEFLNSQKRDILNKNSELRKLNDDFKYQQKQIEDQNEELIEQRDSIERINNNLSQGVNYAVSIQQAIFPSKEKLSNILGEHFVWYKPKDEVGGDFYYVTQLDHYRLIAVGDCTGHGVPGGFLTMLGMSLLKNLINADTIKDPSRILNELRAGIIDSFEQTGQMLQQTDGIDIAISVINDKTNVLLFAGGRGNMVMVNEKEAEIIRGDRIAVSFTPRMKQFTTQRILLSGNEILYMYTDGYTDQFNQLQVKIGRQRFLKLCAKLYQKPLSLQKETFLSAFENWSAGYEQIDDALVLGFKAKKG